MNKQRNITSLLRDAQALLDNAIDKALVDAGSNRGELRLLGRIDGGTDSARIDLHVQHPGSLAATFAARGWIEYAEGAWRLTATGTSEYIRLQQIVADTTTQATGAESTLEADLTTLVDALGGTDAAREARHERRHARQDRHHKRHHGAHHGAHPFAGESCGDHGHARPEHGGRGYRGYHGDPRAQHEHRGFDPRGQHGDPRGQHGDPRARAHRGQRSENRSRFDGPRFSENPQDLDRMIRDLGRGFAPLMPFLRDAFRDAQRPQGPRFGERPRGEGDAPQA